MRKIADGLVPLHHDYSKWPSRCYLLLLQLGADKRHHTQVCFRVSRCFNLVVWLADGTD